MGQRDYIVGDIFRIYIKDLEKYKFVALTRTVVSKEHFTLISLASMERWTDRVITVDDEYRKTKLDKNEVEYLANTSQIEYVGNIDEFKKDISKLISEKSGVTV